MTTTLQPHWHPTPPLFDDELESSATPPPGSTIDTLWRAYLAERESHRALRQAYREMLLTMSDRVDEAMRLRLKNLRIGLQQLVDVCRKAVRSPDEVARALRVADGALSYEQRNGERQ